MSWYVKSSKPDLARVARARHDDRSPVVLRLRALHEREVPRLGEQAAHHVDRVRPLDRQETPVLVIHQVEPIVGLFFLQHAQYPRCIRRVRHHEESLRLESVDDQIFDHPTALVQDEVVEGLAHRRLRQVVRDDALQHADRAGTGDVDLPEVREIEQTDPFADGAVLGERPLVLDRHEPAGERAELCAEPKVFVLERRVFELVGGGFVHQRHRTATTARTWAVGNGRSRRGR